MFYIQRLQDELLLRLIESYFLDLTLDKENSNGWGNEIK
jgi:hypothetical protein